MTPYNINFEYLAEASTVIVAPDAEAASAGAKTILAKNGLRGVNITEVSEISDTEDKPVLN